MYNFISFPESVKYGLGSSYIINISDLEHGIRDIKIFAQKIMCEKGGCGYCNTCSKIDREEHPDLIFTPSDEEYNGSENIKIDEIRKLQSAAYFTSFEAKYRICIIKYADKMTEQAQNSILKILEEPPSNTIFILLTDNIFGLLSTIRSRCRLFNYPFTKKIDFDFKGKLDELFIIANSDMASFFNFCKTISESKETLLSFVDFSVILLRDVLALKCNGKVISNGIEEKILSMNFENTVNKIEQLNYYRTLVSDRNVNKELVAINVLSILFGKV